MYTVSSADNQPAALFLISFWREANGSFIPCFTLAGVLLTLFLTHIWIWSSLAGLGVKFLKLPGLRCDSSQVVE